MIIALLVGGTVFVAFGMATWFFAYDTSLMWVFWAFGVGLWAFALAIFLYFSGGGPLPQGRRDG